MTTTPLLEERLRARAAQEFKTRIDQLFSNLRSPLIGDTIHAPSTLFVRRASGAPTEYQGVTISMALQHIQAEILRLQAKHEGDKAILTFIKQFDIMREQMANLGVDLEGE